MSFIFLILNEFEGLKWKQIFYVFPYFYEFYRARKNYFLSRNCLFTEVTLSLHGSERVDNDFK